MRRIVPLLGLYCQAALLWQCYGLPVLAQEAPPKEIAPEVIDAWKRAGAIVAWLWQDENGHWQNAEVKPKHKAALPAFHWHKPAFDLKGVAKLPAPSAPFGFSVGYFLSAGPGAEAGLKELAGFKNLQFLDLSNTAVTDAGLKELAPLKNLKTLRLSNTRVTDKGMKELAGFSDLQTLDLSHTQLTEVGLKELGNLQKLEALDLGFTKVPDAGLKELARLTSLKCLYLGSTKVTDAGVAELRKALPDLKIKR